MAKKLFSDVIKWDESVGVGVAGVVNGAATWVAQEDILVESVQISAVIGKWTTGLAVQGVESTELIAEVSQAGALELPGVMSSVRVDSVITVQGAITPNVVPVGGSVNSFASFASPFSVKEDGSINLHVYRNNQTPSIIAMNVKAIITYTKAS